MVWTNDFTTLSDLCGATGSALVVFTATDDCGNTSTTSATFTIEDTTAPDITTLASDLTVECDGAGNVAELNAWLAANGGAVASDICSGSVVWTNNFTTLSDLCGATGSALVVFTATDDCGNTSTTSATFTIEDTTAPDITTLASDLTVECDGAGNVAELNAWLAANGGAVASDICSGSVVWTNDFTTLSDLCGATGSALVVFTATDDCGNTSTTSATFTIEDTTAPDITTLASDLTVECDGAGNAAQLNAWLAANGGAVASDICSGSVVWTNNFTTLSDLCGATGSALVVFTATDDCGNTSTTSATFTIEDTTAPDITTLASDLTVECDGAGNVAELNAWLAANGGAVASDICSGSVVWTNNFTTLSDLCGATGSALVVFTATDDCGNTSTTSATFTIEDTTAPDITTLASDLTVECDGAGNAAQLNAWLAANGGAVASDICSGSVVWTNNFTTLSDLCGSTGSALVVFTATDDCGNTSTTSATFTIEDTTAPDITTLASDLTVECDGAGNVAELNAWLAANGGAVASDICSGSVVWTNNFTTLSDLCGATGSALVVFTATDDCGNTSTTSATFTIEDTTAPVIICPVDITIFNDPGKCGATIVLIQPTYIEDCSAVTITNSLNLPENASAFYPVGTTTIEWTIVDECGNISTCSMTVTVIDNELPVINCPSDIIACSTETIILEPATGSDNCGDVIITNNAPATFDPGVTLITWTATTQLGVSVSCTQTVTVIAEPTAYAGQDEITCEGLPFTITTATASGYSSLIWTTNGQGTILNDTTLTPTYVPANNETGFVYLILTANGIGPCGIKRNQMRLTITPAPLAYTGPNDSICEGQSYTTVNAGVKFTSNVMWTTNGDGIFADPKLVITTYAPGSNDIINGSVILTLTSTGLVPCGNASASMVLTINQKSIADAGSDDEICENMPYTVTDASAQNYTSIIWTHNGAGTLVNTNTLTPTYTPALNETGTISLKLLVTGLTHCSNALDVKLLTINNTNQVYAGSDIESCDLTPISLSSATVTGTTSIKWTTSGSGIFENDTLINATYLPSQQDVDNGTVTLTISSTSITLCGISSDELLVTLIKGSRVFAGHSATVCMNQSYTITDATISSATSVSWTHDGLGTLENANTITPTYVPALDETGLIHLFVTAIGDAPCGSATDSLTLMIVPGANAYAGSDIESCLAEPVLLSSAAATNYASLQWTTSGTGSFDNNTLVNPVYTPGTSDINNGFVDLMITADGSSGCGNAVDTIRIDFSKAPLAFAGNDEAICSAGPYTLQAATAANYSSIKWTHNGNGTLSDPSILNPIYTPATNEKVAVEFILTVYGSSTCGNMVISDMVTLTFVPEMAVNAGIDQSIIEGTATTLNGIVAGGSGLYSFNWSPVELLLDNSVLKPKTTVLNTETLFTLTVVDMLCGSVQTDEILITLNDIQRPLAVNDYDTTGLNSPTLVNILINDSDPIGLGLNVSITSYPTHGVVTLNEDGSIQYTPEFNYTGNDTLTYVICDNGSPSKCSSAQVVITIFPYREYLDVYHLVTPDNDGKNDYWHIGGIDEFPDNEIVIFNRWGDKVRDFRGYNNLYNNWNGKNEKDALLPDGVYYYIIKLADVKTYTGWVYVRGNWIK